MTILDILNTVIDVTIGYVLGFYCCAKLLSED